MEKNERIMNVLEGLWSAHARSSPVSSPLAQFSVPEIRAPSPLYLQS